MFLKEDVDPTALRPELIIAILVAQEVYRLYGRELVITSLNDSRHSLTSLHYAGAAVDIRTNHLDLSEPQKDEIREKIRERLPRHYDVVLESDHLHIEYQPRRKSG